MTGPDAVTAAVTLVWFGMVTAISFLEAPLKFGAPDVTLRIGLGIGRRVFRALNTVEAFLAAAVVVSLAIGSLPTATVILAGVAIGVLVVQLVGVRPRLSRRSDAVLAGEEAPRSRAHYAYIAAETVKALCLLASGISALAVHS